MAEPITPGEQRIELQLEGLRSVTSGGFLVTAAGQLRIEKLLERIATAVETLAAAAAQDDLRTTDHGTGAPVVRFKP